MHINIGRRIRLGALGVGLITAAAFALAASGPALADTTDTGGTATLIVPRALVVGLAKGGIIVLPGAPATSTYTAGTGNWNSTASYTFTVTGGNGEVSNFFGTVDLGGTLVLVGTAHSATVTITNLKLNFFNGDLTGVINGAPHSTAIAYIGGSLSESTGSGTETFSADQLTLTTQAATAINKALGTKTLIHGVDIGGFTTTFDVTVS